MYMRYKDFKILTEKHYSGPLYHSTGVDYLSQILSTGYFILSKTNEKYPIEKHFSKQITKGYNSTNKGFPYFMSFSRDKNNSYKKYNAATLVLDPSNYNNNSNFKLIPVDYHEFYPDEYTVSRRSEAEERLWSKIHKISANNILEIHVNISITGDSMGLFDMIRHIEEKTIAKSIPLFLYGNEFGKFDNGGYNILNKRKAAKSLEEFTRNHLNMTVRQYEEKEKGSPVRNIKF